MKRYRPAARRARGGVRVRPRRLNRSSRIPQAAFPKPRSLRSGLAHMADVCEKFERFCTKNPFFVKAIARHMHVGNFHHLCCTPHRAFANNFQ